jgi:hypothetical protein
MRRLRVPPSAGGPTTCCFKTTARDWTRRRSSAAWEPSAAPRARRSARLLRAWAPRCLARPGRRKDPGRTAGPGSGDLVLPRRRRPSRTPAPTCSTRPPRRPLGWRSGSSARAPALPCRSPSGAFRPNARLRTLVSQLVQLRPILQGPQTRAAARAAGRAAQLVVYPGPDPDPERPVLVGEEVEVQLGVHARIVVCRAAQAIPLGPSRATRRGGLVVRSRRAAHEVTPARLDGHPGAGHLYGEVWCEALERLQREALESPRPQVVARACISRDERAPPLGHLTPAPDDPREHPRPGCRLPRSPTVAGVLALPAVTPPARPDRRLAAVGRDDRSLPHARTKPPRL